MPDVAEGPVEGCIRLNACPSSIAPLRALSTAAQAGAWLLKLCFASAATISLPMAARACMQ